MARASAPNLDRQGTKETPMQRQAIGVILRHVAFSEELVHYATEHARRLATSVRSVGSVEVVMQSCRTLQRTSPMFEVQVEACHKGVATSLRHRGADVFLAVRDALVALRAQLELEPGITDEG